jgi:hypothetical protein
MIFRRKKLIITHEHQVSISKAEAMHIKRTGSYILQLENTLPMEQIEKITKMLRQSTGAKWIVVQGGAKVIQND